MKRGLRCLILLTVAIPPATFAADNVELVLEASLPPIVGQVPEAAPPRFALLDDGRVFLGGTSDVLEGRLTGRPLKELRGEIARLHKLKGLAERVEFGPGEAQFRLRLAKGRVIVAKGDPQTAPPEARAVAGLVDKLLRFDDPSLRLYRPERYELAVRHGALVGGCRAWTLPVALVDALATPRVVSATAAAGWPTGALAASVCAGDKSFIVTLRPLLPWEHR